MLKTIEILSFITLSFININQLNLIAFIVKYACTNKTIQLHYYLFINCIVFN